jgi:hypothetical protein
MLFRSLSDFAAASAPLSIGGVRRPSRAGSHGDRYVIEGDYMRNLADTGFNDRAQSLHVDRGYWIWIESSGGRLSMLLLRHAHAMKVYRTGNAARAAMNPLLIVDDTHFVHRYHVGRTGGTLSIGDPERAKPLVDRFDEIWETGEPGVTGTVLGL